MDARLDLEKALVERFVEDPEVLPGRKVS